MAACGGETAAEDKSSRDGDVVEELKIKVDPEIEASIPEELRKKVRLEVPTTAGTAPMAFFDDDNKSLVGVDPDIAQALGAVMGLDVEVVNASFESIIPGLKTGRYNYAVANMSASEERQQVVDFVTYIYAGSAVLVKAGNPDGIDIENMCGTRMGVTNGSIHQNDVVPHFNAKCVEEGHDPIDMQTFPSISDGELALSSGRIDGVIVTASTGAYLVDMSSGKFEMTKKQHNANYGGIAIAKDSGLTEPIQKALTKLIEDGTYEQILQRWGMSTSEGGTDKATILDGSKS